MPAGASNLAPEGCQPARSRSSGRHRGPAAVARTWTAAPTSSTLRRRDARRPLDHGAGRFILTNVHGTPDCWRRRAGRGRSARSSTISTDEVYGSDPSGSSVETDALSRQPRTRRQGGRGPAGPRLRRDLPAPGAGHARSNNYGPYQFPEKVIPLFVTHLIDDIPVPLYGDGMNVRDWLHVDDHCRAVEMLLAQGVPGETYNVGGGNEVPNIELTKRILALVGKPESLIQPVTDRLGHDRRYSLDCSKLRAMGWSPRVPFEQGLAETVEWYRAHPEWWRPLKEANPAFREHYQRHYRG